jgi:hypothetical protein
MNHAKLFSVLVFLVVLVYGAIGYFLLPLASFQGDLTRMAMLPESQFGWRKPQPAIVSNLLIQSPLQEADVLVIGDSFSDSRVWQVALKQRGLKVRTISWSSIGSICDDFIPWVRGQGFQGKFVVMEIIERNIESGLKKSVACKNMQANSDVTIDHPRYPPSEIIDFAQSDRSGRFSVGIQTALNYRGYEKYSSNSDFDFRYLNNGAKLARVKNGCDLFSHPKCNDALFLAEDKADDLNSNVLEDIKILNTRLDGVTPIWAFVPNKSTTYLHPNKGFWSEVNRRFGSPNLLQMNQVALRKITVDLYPANNTHYSTTGYLLMGEEIFKSMSVTTSKQPTP